jgi:hypothetical protein
MGGVMLLRFDRTVPPFSRAFALACAFHHLIDALIIALPDLLLVNICDPTL